MLGPIKLSLKMDHYIPSPTHECFFLLISTLPTYKYHLVGDRKVRVPLVARVGEHEWALPGGGNPISAICQQPQKTLRNYMTEDD